MSRALIIACSASGAAASLGETIGLVTRERNDPDSGDWPQWRLRPPRRTAVFGTSEASRSEQAMGKIKLELGRNQTYTAIEWTVEDLSIPAKLVEDICGSTDMYPSFMYAIHDKWDHRHGRSAQGSNGCSTRFTGKRWDPTAACSEWSGNPACNYCRTQKGYRCSPETFDPSPDAKGSYAYRFLNNDACELGDLSGMHGELVTPMNGDKEDADCRDSNSQCQAWADMSQCDENPGWMLSNCKVSCGVCQDAKARKYYQIDDLVNDTAGYAQMSAPFGSVDKDSVDTSLIGINCDASGPPIDHATNCGCIREREQHDNREEASSIGTLTVFGSFPFYLADHLRELDGKSIVISCGSVYGDKVGEPLFCAKLK